MILKKIATLRGIGLTSIDKPIQMDRYSDAHKAKVSKIKGDPEVNW